MCFNKATSQFCWLVTHRLEASGREGKEFFLLECERQQACNRNYRMVEEQPPMCWHPRWVIPESNPRTCHMGKPVKASFREHTNERKTCFLWRAYRVRLKWGFSCQTLCVMKSWLFWSACFCIPGHSLQVQWLPLQVPTSMAGEWPNARSHIPGTTRCRRAIPGHTEFSLSRKFF